MKRPPVAPRVRKPCRRRVPDLGARQPRERWTWKYRHRVPVREVVA